MFGSKAPYNPIELEPLSRRSLNPTTAADSTSTPGMSATRDHHNSYQMFQKGGGGGEKHIHLASPSQADLERGGPGGYAKLAVPSPGHSRNSSVSGLGADPKHGAHEAAHRRALIVPPENENKVAKVYTYLMTVSVVTRWILFIVPILALIWIPGILHFTKFPDGHIWFVNLLWWSIWLSVLWVGWWAALAVSFILPKILKNTLAAVIVGLRRYIDWLVALHRYFALLGWSIACFVSYQALINRTQAPYAGQKSKDAVDMIGRIVFAIMLCCAILLGEKIAIQAIATSFHERSYAERLTEQRKHTDTLVVLYANSTDHPERNDTLHDNPAGAGTASGFMGNLDPNRLLRNVLKGVRGVAQTTTQAFGNIATEIVGESVLQPNSPQAMVATALTSVNKSRLLARRLFYSFRQPRAEHVVLSDIQPYFMSQDAAIEAFSMFDKDQNGDATRDEMELACLELHRERLALASSMRDLDSAVGRLDNILMSVYVVVAGIVFAVTLDASVSTLLSGAAAFILALSWLIGASMQEILASIIFLFIKHMYDVGDRVEIDNQIYTVKEIRLLSTIFIDVRGCTVQAPHVLLNGKFIYNMRRSQQMSESFVFDVSYDTSFEQIEQLRTRMLAFVKSERRDYQPAFDVIVENIPEQTKMTLKADIKYKSNWQQGALKVQRRNKWICALKGALHEVKIFGPAGDPGVVAAPSEYTLVPWDEVQAAKNQKAEDDEYEKNNLEPRIPRGDFAMVDRNHVLLDQGRDVFGESKELNMTAPKQTTAARGYGGRQTAAGAFDTGATSGQAGVGGAVHGTAQPGQAGAAAAGAAGGVVIGSMAAGAADDGN